MADDLVVDPWMWLDYKPTFPDAKGIKGNLVPTWVGEHFRRLAAYNFLEAYYRNAARMLLDVANLDQEDIDKRREYGDPYVIVQQMVASVLGEEVSIIVADSEGEDPVETAIAQLEVLLQWAEDERLQMKLIENERNCEKLGDGVLVLYDDDTGVRPRLRCYNPGFYFPVLDGELDRNGWPKKVHLAWEFEKIVDGRKERFVTRATWELREIDGGGTQTLPWSDEPVEETVYYSKGTWKLADIRPTQNDPDLFSDDRADWEKQNEDLEIDYIPLIHVPNTVAEEEHFGTSVFSNVLQIFDDLISNDTDKAASAAITGTPPIAVSGASLPVDDNGRVAGYGPGTVWQTGDGSAEMIDTSKSLDALLKNEDALLKRLSINTRIPESLLGRIKPSEVPSGITLALSFTPHSADIREKRMVRDEKMALLLKMVTRWYMKNGDLTQFHKATMFFGPFLPSHKKEVVDLIVQLRSTKPPSISTETAILMLVQAGFPIEDAALEVQRIIQSDFESASQMLDVVGEPNPVRARLGLPPLPEPEPVEDEGEGDIGEGL